MIFDYCSTRQMVDESRRGAMATHVAENRVICRVLGRMKMFVDSRDISILPHLCCDGIINAPLTETLCSVITPGTSVVDVGASFGYHTLIAAEKVGPSGHVFSFEPYPRVFPMLKWNIEINGFSKWVRPYPIALGAASDNGELSTHPRRFANATLAAKAKASYGDKQEPRQVDVRRLDDVIQQADTFIISAEGYEPEIWAGAKAVLSAKRKCTVVMEFFSRWYADPAGFAVQILDLGFQMQRITEHGLLPVVPEELNHSFKHQLLLTR